MRDTDIYASLMSIAMLFKGCADVMQLDSSNPLNLYASGEQLFPSALALAAHAEDTDATNVHTSCPSAFTSTIDSMYFMCILCLL